MIIEKKSTVSSKIRRSSSEKSIHYLFIFNKSGICLYGKNFTGVYKLIDKQLLSSFFTALRAFTKEVIGTNIKTVGMGEVKFVLIRRGSVYYGILCNSHENLILLETIISKISFKFTEYVNKNNINMEVEYIYDKDLNFIIDEIVEDIFSKEFNLEKELKIIEELKKLASKDEINGLILLTDKGKVIYSSLNQLYLNTFLKEVEFRVKIFNNSILKLFYTSKNKELIFSEYVENLYFIILVFNSEIKFGIADLYLEKAVKIIKNGINHEEMNTMNLDSLFQNIQGL